MLLSNSEWVPVGRGADMIAEMPGALPADAVLSALFAAFFRGDFYGHEGGPSNWGVVPDRDRQGRILNLYVDEPTLFTPMDMWAVAAWLEWDSELANDNANNAHVESENWILSHLDRKTSGNAPADGDYDSFEWNFRRWEKNFLGILESAKARGLKRNGVEAAWLHQNLVERAVVRRTALIAWLQERKVPVPIELVEALAPIASKHLSADAGTPTAMAGSAAADGSRVPMEQVEAFLRAQGPGPRKARLPEARAAFGSRLTTRIFDAAFKAAYDTSVGRRPQASSTSTTADLPSSGEIGKSANQR